MKNYFNFNLTGKKLFPYWIMLLVFFMAPYFLLIFKMKEIMAGDPKSVFIIIPALLVLFFIASLLSYFIEKISIEGIEYKNKSLVFKGKFGQFIGISLLGGFLSIITLGIYSPWFIKSIQKFFIDNSTYDSTNPEFRGTGGSLFVILLLTLILPIIIISAALGIVSVINHTELSGFYRVIYQIFIFIIMIPYIYYVYKWCIDIKFKQYSIQWETEFWPSCSKILVEVLLSIITLGIYSPLASLRLYKYFAEKTVATSEEGNKTFGYDIEPQRDFLFIWGQSILAILTLGIYYPWAFCKVRSRILSKTFTQDSIIEA
jgi:uncharacterized membrane protein YjgN (DUF898 family)